MEDDRPFAESIGPKRVQTEISEVAGAVEHLLLVFSGGDRQVILGILHYALADLSGKWLRGDGSEGALKVYEERRAECRKTWERMELLWAGLSPAQMALLSAKALIEAARAYGAPEEEVRR